VEGVAVLLWCEFGPEGWGESGEGGGRGVELFFVRGCSEDGVEGGGLSGEEAYTFRTK